MHFFGYLVYGISFWPESWRESLYIYLLSFPRFRSLSIERVWFLFWSLFNGVTLKTSNCGRRESERCAKTWPSGQAPHLLSFLLFIFVFALSQFSGPDYLGAWNKLSKARTLRPYQTKNNSKLAWCTIKALPPAFRVTKRQTSTLSPIDIALVAGTKCGGGRGREKSANPPPPPFFSFSLSPTPFDAYFQGGFQVYIDKSFGSVFLKVI